MSRSKRVQCESDIYHVTARGVGKQIIFEDDGDRRKFGSLMRKRLAGFEVELYAWCFMQNHVHLLLNCPIETLSQFMGKLLSEYAGYYNWRYERTGHLFQGRFNSKPVEDDRQFLAVIRYIHQNPISLGVTDLESYPWSSYREYVRNPFITSTEWPLLLFGGIESFENLHREVVRDDSLEPGHRCKRHFETDDHAIARAKEVLGCSSLAEIAAANRKTRDNMIALLRDDGFTIAQIARLTGISRNIIQRAKKNE